MVEQLNGRYNRMSIYRIAQLRSLTCPRWLLAPKSKFQRVLPLKNEGNVSSSGYKH